MPIHLVAEQRGAHGRAGTAIDPDNYRVTINAHAGYNVYATNGVHYVTAKENDTFENIGEKFRLGAQPAFNDLKDKKAQPVPGEASGHRAQEEK